MPTNQSSPWGGAKLTLTSSHANSPSTTTSVSTHTKTVVATKVPFAQTSPELSRRKDQAKPLSSSAQWETGNGSKTVTLSQIATVPCDSPKLPPQLNGVQSSIQVPPSEAGSVPTEAAQTSCGPVQLTGAVQKCVSLKASQPGDGVAVGACQDGEAPPMEHQPQPSLQMLVSAPADLKTSVFHNNKLIIN